MLRWFFAISKAILLAGMQCNIGEAAQLAEASGPRGRFRETEDIRT